MAYSFPQRLNTLFWLMLPTTKRTEYGTLEVGYTQGNGFWACKRTFGGTEEVVNGVTVIKNTAVVDCYFNNSKLQAQRQRGALVANNYRA